VIKFLLIVSVIGLSGCFHQHFAMPDDPRFRPIALNYNEEPTAINGSLFSANPSLALYSNDVALKLGDVITVVLSEGTSATKNVSANYKKGNKINSHASIFGAPGKLGILNKLPFSAGNDTGNLSNDLNSDAEFTGSGGALQNNQLNGKISATITQILPNKNLVIAGEKWVTIGNGEEYIRVSGIVRPQDIKPDNTVMSTSIADARISYSGTGDLQRGTVPGWLARLFNATFYPF
jgi:flagellar L-ring protein precursor FlgH